MGGYISQDPIKLNGGNATFYSYVSNLNLWIDPLGLFIVYRGTKSDQLPFTPSQRDIQMYNKTGEKPGFSTFKDEDTIWNVSSKKGPLFDEAIVMETDYLGADLKAVPDGSNGHVSIMPTDEYLKKNNMTMSEALEDWKNGGSNHTLSQQAQQSEIGRIKRDH